MSKTKVFDFRVSSKMAEAIELATDLSIRESVSEFLREDCLRPKLQEMGLWPPRRLTDARGRYEVVE